LYCFLLAGVRELQLYVFTEDSPDLDIYSVLIEHEGKYQCEAEEEMDVSDEILIVGSPEIHRSIKKYKEELSEGKDDWIKDNCELLKKQVAKAEQNCKYYENKLLCLRKNRIQTLC